MRVLWQIAIVLEYMNGGSLGDILEKVRAPSCKANAHTHLTEACRLSPSGP